MWRDWQKRSGKRPFLAAYAITLPGYIPGIAPDIRAMLIPSLAPVSKADPLMLRLWQSGRELFHSNTLAFLIADAQYGPCLLEKLTGDGGWTNYDVRTLREKWQLDIVVIARKKPGPAPSPNQEPCAGNAEQVKTAFQDWRIVVIENKFKSLPDRGQLMRYTEKLDDRFRQNPPGNEGCNGQRDAGAKLLCELWRADFPEKETEDDGSEEANESNGNTLTNYKKDRVKGTLYRVILQPTLASAPPTPCSSKPCLGCASPPTDCVKITLPNKSKKATPGSTLVRHWRAVSYRDLMRCLPARLGGHGSPLTKPAPSLAHSFVPVYRSLVVRTCNLHRQLRGGQNPFSAIDQLQPSAQALGIWDFIDKWRYGWLTEKTRVAVQRVVHPASTPQLQFNSGRSQLPDHPGRVGLFTGLNGLRCWILASAGYSLGRGHTTIELVYYLDHHLGSRSITLGKYRIALQLQGGSLKLMLCHSRAIKVWSNVAGQRLQTLSSQLSPCLPAQFSTGSGSPTLRSYGGGQKVSVLASSNQLTQKPGSILYWSVQMWSGNPPAGHWASNDMDHITGCLACSVRSILQWLDANAIVNGVANPHWF